MGKSGKHVLGRALVKDRFGANRGKKKVDNGCMLHTTEVQDGYDWGRLNLQSVTEESSFQEFLSTAELAGTEFQAEKLNLRLVSISTGAEAVTTPESRASTEKRHKAAKHLLRVPRRPQWSKDMTPDQLQDNERLAFLNWRRDLATLQETEGLLLTPYEKNLEFWRQLWRVVERSQLLVQVLDARNPLLFRCEDLEAYAKEVGVNTSLLLLNKADLLSEQQRIAWAEYFDQRDIKVAFFSAVLAAEKTKLENAEKRKLLYGDSDDSDFGGSGDTTSDESDQDSVVEVDVQNDNRSERSKSPLRELQDDIKELDDAVDKTADKLKQLEIKLQKAAKGSTPEETKASTSLVIEVCQDGSEETTKRVKFDPDTEETKIDSTNKVRNSIWAEKNNPNILEREELLQLLRSANSDSSSRLSVGMVGYPNVGKSSTINALMTAKKVSVSATPGKTKHFQTLLLTDDLMLCDCPGLVLPSFVCTKAEMVVHGILPIDQMREYMEAITLLVEGLGGRVSAERRMGLLLPPAPAERPDHLPPRDLLLAYAYSRGMMTGGGVPDCARAARAILHAAAAGRLPLAVPPPDSDPDTFLLHSWPPLPEEPETDKAAPRRQMTPQEKRATKSGETSEDLDNAFFSGNSQGAHAKGIAGKYSGLPTARMVNGSATDEQVTTGKPWKKINRHANKKKKEKLRRTFAHLDQH